MLYVAVGAAGGAAYLYLFRGWRLSDLMYVTRASLTKSVAHLTSGKQECGSCVCQSDGSRSGTRPPTSSFRRCRAGRPDAAAQQCAADAADADARAVVEAGRDDGGAGFAQGATERRRARGGGRACGRHAGRPCFLQHRVDVDL